MRLARGGSGCRLPAGSHRTVSCALLLALLLPVLSVPVLAGNPENQAEAGRGVVRSIAPLNPAPGEPPISVLYPPDASGYPGEIRDSRDVAPYLAWHQAEAARRQQAEGTREEPNPAEAYYDARYYDLTLNLNPATHVLTGVVTGRFTVVSGPLTQLVLDLSQTMNVSAVTCGGVAVTSTHASRLLTVNLDRAYNNGETITLVISYSGNPADNSTFGWDTAYGRSMIWTLSEAFGARNWWPCKDYPDDKADSVDVRVTTPTGLITASNGKLRQHTDNGQTAFSWWHEKHPITTYLVSLAIYPYNVYSDWYHASPTDSMEIKFFNYPEDVPSVVEVQARVKDMIAAYKARWGEYPFLDEKYGHAEFNWGGGMEHQTCTSLGYFGESVVAHELGHQWWGDMITCKTFHDVWLNEGFATYCEAIWAEANGGLPAYHAEMNASSYFGPGTIYVPDTSDWNRVFDSNLSYNKASWVLHMLRGMVGDTTFFQIMSTYYNEWKYNSASTADFQAVCESVSGRDLDAFFQEWIYGEYYPIYSFSWSATPATSGYDVQLTVNQIQSWQLFNMAIPVVVNTAAGPVSFQIQNSLASQTYLLHVNAQPSEVQLDPDSWILRTVIAPIPTPTFTKNLLVVNGVDWNTYGTEITTAYQDHAFSGNYTFDFWDCFDTPPGGYPSELPAPLGHGAVPGSVIGQYKAVVWVGGAYGGDDGIWNNTPIYSYLQAGGDVMLMTRMADSYLIDLYRQYLGINWLANGTITDCIASYPGLTNIGRLGTQSYITGYNLTNMGPESLPLYKAVAGHSPNWGLGVMKQPVAGGTYNPTGGRFILLSGRPYRWVHADLRSNMDTILNNLFLLNPAAGTNPGMPAATLSLSRPMPNPFGNETRVRFTLPADGPVRVSVWDVAGRLVRVLTDGPASGGVHELVWDGSDQADHPSPSGIYYVRLQAGTDSREAKLIRLR
jgi:aminopeptidase N